MPSLIACWKASSRFGPVVPLVCARASTWQEPHFATKSCLPLMRLALSASVVRRARAQRQRGARRREPRERGPQAGSGEHRTHRRGTLSQATGGSSARWPCAAAITPPATPSQEKRSCAVATSAACVAARSSSGARSHARHALGDRAHRAVVDPKDSQPRAAAGTAAASIALTSAAPECPAETGSTPQAAASAATIP